MHEYKGRTESLSEGSESVSAVAVESVRRDFSELVDLFDRHLASVGDDYEGRAHLVEARAAAERGLKLSLSLLDMLKTRG